MTGSFAARAKRRNVDGAGCSRQSGDTPSPRSKRQVPAYAIKCGRVLQIREDFADEREDHPLESYQLKSEDAVNLDAGRPIRRRLLNVLELKGALP